MTNEIETKNRVLEASKLLFFKYGYSKVTTNEIARDAGISKKTLYKYYSSKREILDSVILSIKKQLTSDVYDVLQDENIEFVIKLQKVITGIAVALSEITTQFLEDIQRNAPDVWKLISEFKKDAATSYFGKLIDEGVKNNHIKPNVNKEVAILILMTSIQNLFDPDFLNHLPQEILEKIPRSSKDIFDAIVKVVYEGILTDETKNKYASN